MALSSDQALPLISQYESGNANVLNQTGPGGTPASTASGYYQITNPTWAQYAPQAGVDLSQYPTAISAPQSVQTQVASTIFNQQGFGPWSSNTKLMSAVSDTGSQTLPMLDENGNPLQSTDPITGASGLGSAGQAAGAATSQAIGGVVNSYTSWLWQFAERGILLGVGFTFVLVAIIALLWQSKTVKVATSSLAAKPL